MKERSQTLARIEGLAFARAWREANRAHFDALYPEVVKVPCSRCNGTGSVILDAGAGK